MRIYLNRQGIYTRQTVLYSRYRCSRPARCCVFIRGKHPVCGEPLFCLSANPDSLSELCGFHIDHRSRSFLLQVSGVSSRLSFCCTSLVSGFIIHDKGGVVYSQSVQQMRRILHQKSKKLGYINCTKMFGPFVDDLWKKARNRRRTLMCSENLCYHSRQ